MGREALKVRELYAADRIVAQWLEILQWTKNMFAFFKDLS
jgi:hypothetical protein